MSEKLGRQWADRFTRDGFSTEDASYKLVFTSIALKVGGMKFMLSCLCSCHFVGRLGFSFLGRFVEVIMVYYADSITLQYSVLPYLGSVVHSGRQSQLEVKLFNF